MPLTFQAGDGSFQATVDPFTGLAAVRVLCWAADFLSAITEPCPEIGVGLIEAQPRTISRDASGEQGGYHVNITLEGHPDPFDAAFGLPPQVQYSLEGSTEENPIAGHGNLKALLENYQGDDEDGKVEPTWPRTFSDEDGEESRNPMHGVQSFIEATAVWTVRYVTSKLSNRLLEELGTLNTPPGPAPAINARRTWIKMFVRANLRGNVWEVEEGWKLTGPYGVPPELYPTTTT